MLRKSNKKKPEKNEMENEIGEKTCKTKKFDGRGGK